MPEAHLERRRDPTGVHGGRPDVGLPMALTVRLVDISAGGVLLSSSQKTEHRPARPAPHDARHRPVQRRDRGAARGGGQPRRQRPRPLPGRGRLHRAGRDREPQRQSLPERRRSVSASPWPCGRARGLAARGRSAFPGGRASESVERQDRGEYRDETKWARAADRHQPSRAGPEGGDRAHRPIRREGAGHRRERHRQGAGGARPSTSAAPAPTSRSSPSTARAFPKRCSNRSSSAT